MPDKRQTSKQRRAARNRAYREAMIARRESVRAERQQAREAGPARATASAGRGGTTAGGPAPGLAGALYRRPQSVGDTAVLMALAFAVLAAGLSLYVAFTSEVIPVDHAGEPLGQFPAISRQAYAIATGTEPVTEKVSLIDAYGAVIGIFALLPALVLVGVFISHRRQPRSRPLTFGLVALALISVFNGFFAVYFLPSLIALAVAGFQVRKTEMPARTAGAGAGGRQADRDDEDDVIDVDEVEPDDERVEDADLEDVDEADVEDSDVEDVDADADEVEDDTDGEPDDAEREDVLAELEAEIEDETDPEAEPETGRSRRGRGAGGRSSRR